MSIKKYYEIVCDSCGQACHYTGNIILSEAQFRDDGGIVTKGKHYCDEDCKSKAKEKDD